MHPRPSLLCASHACTRLPQHCCCNRVHCVHVAPAAPQRAANPRRAAKCAWIERACATNEAALVSERRDPRVLNTAFPLSRVWCAAADLARHAVQTAKCVLRKRPSPTFSVVVPRPAGDSARGKCVAAIAGPFAFPAHTCAARCQSMRGPESAGASCMACEND